MKRIKTDRSSDVEKDTAILSGFFLFKSEIESAELFIALTSVKLVTIGTLINWNAFH